jgi:ATP-dependent RNA circularization protein (DNA/RNA ligase family)
MVKRVKSGCILQTLVFSQKPELGLSKETALQTNRTEIDRYEASLKRTGTRYQIVEKSEQDDGSIIVHVKKQYNDRVDVSEYFD